MNFIAEYVDGSSFRGGLTDGSFSEIDHSKLKRYSISIGDGFTVSLEMDSGLFLVNGEPVVSGAPAPLRLISYATMLNSIGQGVRSETVCSVVIGWQATVIESGQWKNVRTGIMCDLMTGKWLVTSAI
jgi:hypothetical protein